MIEKLKVLDILYPIKELKENLLWNCKYIVHEMHNI